VTRWLVAIAVALLVIGAGYVVFLNGEPTVVRLTPGRSLRAPLAGVLLGAFLAGGTVVGLLAAGSAGVRGWRGWRARRRAQRDARRAEATARARDLLWHGDSEQARMELLRGESGAPADVPSLALLAESYLQEGDSSAARKVIDEGLVRVGFDPHLLDLLAEACERGGDLRAAAEALERARLTQPESRRLGRRLRDLYAAAGRWPEALSIQAQLLLRVRQPAALAREQQMMRGLRYQAALAEPDPRRAARLLVALAREDPRFVPAWVSAGDLLARAGRTLAARRVWERGARHRPAAVLLERIERANAAERRPERTARVYRRLLRRHPRAAPLPLLFARFLILHDRFEEAGEVLRGLPDPAAGNAFAHLLWGELHRRQGHHDQASAAFAQAAGPQLAGASSFRCAACLEPADAWQGYCPACRRWDTLRADAELAVEAANRPAAVATSSG